MVAMMLPSGLRAPPMKTATCPCRVGLRFTAEGDALTRWIKRAGGHQPPVLSLYGALGFTVSAVDEARGSYAMRLRVPPRGTS